MYNILTQCSFHLIIPAGIGSITYKVQAIFNYHFISRLFFHGCLPTLSWKSSDMYKMQVNHRGRQKAAAAADQREEAGRHYTVMWLYLDRLLP